MTNNYFERFHVDTETAIAAGAMGAFISSMGIAGYQGRHVIDEQHHLDQQINNIQYHMAGVEDAKAVTESQGGELSNVNASNLQEVINSDQASIATLESSRPYFHTAEVATIWAVAGAIAGVGLATAIGSLRHRIRSKGPGVWQIQSK